MRSDSFPYLSVGRLREQIENLPADMPVAYQRIEDCYFETHGWEGEKLAWDQVLTGYDSSGNKVYETIYSEYIVAFSAYEHPDKNIFVINAHY